MHLWDFKRACIHIWEFWMFTMSDTGNHSESYSPKPTKPRNIDLHNNVIIFCDKILRWNVHYNQKNQNVPGNILGMQISHIRYANMDFFKNATYSKTISGKRPGIQIWISGAFYLPLIWLHRSPPLSPQSPPARCERVRCHLCFAASCHRSNQPHTRACQLQLQDGSHLGGLWPAWCSDQHERRLRSHRDCCNCEARGG